LRVLAKMIVPVAASVTTVQQRADGPAKAFNLKT
jgi:hypothetical protein